MLRREIPVRASNDDTHLDLLHPLTAHDIYTDAIKANRLLKNVAKQSLKPYNLGFVQWLILGVVGGGPEEGLSVTEMADRVGISLAQASDLSSKLIGSKLVRQRTRRTDHRNRYLVLSARGKLLLENIEQSMRGELLTTFRHIPKQQLAFYYRVNAGLAQQKDQRAKMN